MRQRLLIVTSVVLAALLVGAAGVFAYDRTGRGTIASGVSVAGIDVGGLNAREARAKLRREYVGRLRLPIVVAAGDRTFTLKATHTKVASDLTTLVDAALAQGRGDSIFKRTWRRITGGTVKAKVATNATFDPTAAAELVRRVRDEVDRAPTDAGVSFSEDKGVVVARARDGLTVRSDALRALVNRAIVDPTVDHLFAAPVRRVAPAVGNDDVARKYKTLLVVDRARFELRLYKGLEHDKTYSVAVGAEGLETPAGMYSIQNKAIDPAWTKPYSSWIKKSEQGQVVPGGTPQNPLKARWLGIFDGAGIHGIDPSEYGSIGHAASHGCVRMRIPDVIELYSRVPVGTPIYIA